MSSNELLPLFPSALHPALPISAQILSTLRALTAPGKGNDLRPEERAALVGVSALLGCEKVQSKDLVESSAQKASSVSPAHFRSALAHSRRILASVSTDTSPSRRSSRSSPSRTSSPSRSTEAGPSGSNYVTTTTAPSPFQTPKKKFKFSSGVDISGLVRSGGAKTPKGHEPATGSPLRHSVTPSKRPDQLELDDEAEAEAEAETSGVEAGRTPTKRVKYAVREGVDLETELERGDVQETEKVLRSTSKRKREDASAFFALRPGSNGASGRQSVRGKGRDIPVENGLPEVRVPRAPRRKVEGRKKARVKPRRDWTYGETEWGVGTDEMDRIFAGLPEWLAAHARPPLGETKLQGDTVIDVLMSAHAAARVG